MSDEDNLDTMRDGLVVEESLPDGSREGRIIPVGQSQLEQAQAAAAMADKDTNTTGMFNPEPKTNSTTASNPSVMPMRSMEMPVEPERTTE